MITGHELILGWNSSSKLLDKWCGVKTDETVESSGRFMYLMVVTDDDNFARGFQLLVTTISDAGKEALTKFTWNLKSIPEDQRNGVMQ